MDGWVVKISGQSRQLDTLDNPAWLIFCETLNLDGSVHTPRMYSLFPTPIQVHYSWGPLYRDQFGEFVCGYWGLKGLKQWRKTDEMVTNDMKMGGNCDSNNENCKYSTPSCRHFVHHCEWKHIRIENSTCSESHQFGNMCPAVMCMEKLYAKHEVTVINMVSGINLHVKLCQGFVFVFCFFFMATNFLCLVTILKLFKSHQKFEKNWAWSTEKQ